jgi:hypothetical protein
MSKEFESEVKKTKPGAARPEPKHAKKPDLKDARKGSAHEEKQDEDSPLKTVGGTPIIERQNG